MGGDKEQEYTSKTSSEAEKQRQKKLDKLKGE